MPPRIPIETSARHIHITKEDFEALFGEGKELTFVKEHIMVSQKYIDELNGFERFIFAKLYAGDFSKKLYHLYEYKKKSL